MSDNQPPKPPKPPAPKPPTPAGSAPAKKETVRITLRSDGEGAAPAPAAPAPPKPAAPRPPAPAAGGAPKPAAPTPPKPAGAAPAPPRPGGAPASPGGAKTVPLNQPAASAASAASAAGAAGAAAEPAKTVAQLPKATVKLQPTQPLAKPTGTAVQSVPTRTAVVTGTDDFEDDDEGILNPLAAIALVLAAVLLLVQLFSWPSKFSPGVDSTPGIESWKIPKDDTHSWMSADGGLKELEVE